MNKLATTSIVLILLFALPTLLSARQASSFMPDAVPAESVFSQTITSVDDDPEEGPETKISVTDIEQLDGNIIRFAVSREEDDITNFDFFAHSDSLYTNLSTLIDTDFFADFGFDIDLDLDRFVSLIRLSIPENQSWTILAESVVVPIPDAVLELLPSGINFRPDMDINVTLRNTRLPNQTIDTPFGSFETVVFQPGLSIEIVLYAIIVVPIPVPATILTNYGPELFFAEGHGIVKEKLDPTILKVTNTFLGIDEEITRLPGQTLVLNSFNSDTSVEHDNDLPTVLRLLPNYPNPFNPTTNLQFETEQAGFISIQVYDIQGRLVREVVQNQLFNAGLHTLGFDGTGLSSGQYIYNLRFNALDGKSSLQTGSFTLVK